MKLSQCCNAEIDIPQDRCSKCNNICYNTPEFKYYVLIDYNNGCVQEIEVPPFQCIEDAKKYIFEEEMIIYKRYLDSEDLGYYYNMEDRKYTIVVEVISNNDLVNDHIFQSELSKAQNEAAKESYEAAKEYAEKRIANKNAEERSLYEQLKAKYETGGDGYWDLKPIAEGPAPRVPTVDLKLLI